MTYDITNRWSVGCWGPCWWARAAPASTPYGAEVGYVVVDNLWVTLGYNFRGFSDTDLTGSDYTNRGGWVLGVRYKFDEDLFRKNDATVNKTLAPGTAWGPQR